MELNKNKALSKEETKGLISLIEESEIINNKKTNATSNKMKVEEWIRITKIFNANIGITRRTPQQLRLKWENLKKNSRRRSTLIRMDRLKTGGGTPGYHPPDEILDRVAELLGSTGEEHNVVPTRRIENRAVNMGNVISTPHNKKCGCTGVKRKLLRLDNSVKARNKAITEYYNLKSKMLESKVQNIELENEKLKLEIKRLKREDIQ